jgi:hypothetical protein
MVLSNAERQRRYKDRLKAAAQGVTPEMVVEAVRLHWEQMRADDPALGTWEEYLASCRTRRGRLMWRENLVSWKAEHFEGDGEELMRKVAGVIEALMNPPKA